MQRPLAFKAVVGMLSILLPSMLFLAMVAGCGQTSSVDRSAVDAIEQLGGTVRHDAGRVVKVDLSRSRATDADLLKLSTLSQLERLYLPSSITDAGLANLKGLASLTTLDLQNTQVTDAGLEHLKALPKLTQLYVAGTQITKEALDRLHSAVPRLTIERYPIDRPK